MADERDTQKRPLLQQFLSNKRYTATLLIMALIVARNLLAGFKSLSGPYNSNNRLLSHGAESKIGDSNTGDASSSVRNESASASLTIDFLSIGSIKKRSWQEGQLRTFGANPHVRNFFLVDERNDTDATCHTNFTDNQLLEVINFCNNTEGQTHESALIRKKLFWPKRHTGWLCAQKRPIDGVYAAVKNYQETGQLPSYLMIIDDDTFVNVDRMVEIFREHYNVDDNHVVAGCRYTWPRKIFFSFPYGGFSSILTRASLQRLIQPLYCEESNTNMIHNDKEFNTLACWRLQQNIVGEADYFSDGMSVGELMYKFGEELPFTGVQRWVKNGFCFHSDHALGYFFGFYHLSVPHGILETRKLDDTIRMDHGYEFLAGDKQCGYEKQKCVPEASICHYVRPERMDKLHSAQQRSAPVAGKSSNATV